MENVLTTANGWVVASGLRIFELLAADLSPRAYRSATLYTSDVGLFTDVTPRRFLSAAAAAAIAATGVKFPENDVR